MHAILRFLFHQHSRSNFPHLTFSRHARTSVLMSGLLACCVPLAFASSSIGAEPWSQASGPNANWKVDGVAPTQWSVVRNENIVWRTTLPEGGQSAVTVFGNRAFLTCHQEMSAPEEARKSTDVVGYCLDANSGKILWRVDLPGSVAVGTAGIFSDATVFAPVTDGEHVWFFNRSGSMGCYDYDGNQVWLREYRPRNRHTNRECEPILVGDQIITLEVRDKEAGAKIERHKPASDDIDEKSVWTYLHGIDKRTGKVLWTETSGTSCHHTPMIGTRDAGTLAIVHARGGGHGPLERPYGISMTSLEPGREGTPLWSLELAGIDPSFNGHWDKKYVYAFQKMDHVVLSTWNGKLLHRRSVQTGVDQWSYDLKDKNWKLKRGVNVRPGKRIPLTHQTNIVVGDWHYFLTHDFFAVGRVNTKNGQVEYLQVPAQVEATSSGNRLIWNKKDLIPIATLNSRGIDIATDKRAQRSGWGHVSAASPILVGRYLYFPLMTGSVLVIDTEAKEFGDAFVTANDLGPAGETWTLSSFSYQDGSLYIRTMKEVIRIGSSD